MASPLSLFVWRGGIFYLSIDLTECTLFEKITVPPTLFPLRHVISDHRGNTMQKIRRTATLILPYLSLAALIGCSQSSGTDNTPQNLPRAVKEAFRSNTPVDTKIVTANTKFGFSLFQELLKTESDKNLFLSPTSLSLALQIVYNGAKADTQKAMDATLKLNGLSFADLNSMNAALQASLVSKTDDVKLTIANGLWFRSDAVSKDFVDVNTDFYGSELGDMTGIPDSANAWVKEKTNGKIEKILPVQDYTNTIAVIVNAVYFKGAWTDKFDAAKTADGDFTLTGGTTKKVPMMKQQVTTEFYKGTNFRAVRLPYGADRRLRLVVFLPDPGTTLKDFLTTLTPENWQTWGTKFTKALVTLEFPRFKSEYGKGLKDALTAMGMGVAFDSTKANFEGIAKDSYLQFVEHKTFLEINEEGTEAAGATSVGIGVTSAPTPQEFKANRPFFAAIEDSKTNVILFMGQIVNP
jgi:serpin B